MNEIIQIKCPFCGALLSLKNIPGIEKKKVTCPICKQTNGYAQYLTPSSGMATPPRATGQPKPQGDFGGNNDETTQYGPMNFNIGHLILQGSGISYQLRPGKNSVGRKSSNSTVDFQIDTAPYRRMSRNHLTIDVVNEPHKGFVHYVSLSKENVNPTTVDGNPLHYGVDRMILHNGTVIRLPDAELRFEMPDEDATELSFQ